MITSSIRILAAFRQTRVFLKSRKPTDNLDADLGGTVVFREPGVAGVGRAAFTQKARRENKHLVKAAIRNARESKQHRSKYDNGI